MQALRRLAPRGANVATDGLALVSPLAEQGTNFRALFRAPVIVPRSEISRRPISISRFDSDLPSAFDRAGNNDFGTDGAERTA